MLIIPLPSSSNTKRINGSNKKIAEIEKKPGGKKVKGITREREEMINTI